MPGLSRLWRLAREGARALASQRLYAALMMAGLIIGVASLTVIQEIGEGARARVTSMMQSIGFGADAFYVSSGGGRLEFRRGQGREKTMVLGDAEAVARLENVIQTYPHQNVSRRKVSTEGGQTFTRITGVTPGWNQARRWNVAAGRFVDDTDMSQQAQVAVLGASVAAELFGGRPAVGRRVRVGRSVYQVIGVLESKGISPRGHNRDDRVMVPLSTLLSRLTKGDKISGMRVLLADPGAKEQTVGQIRALLRQRHRLPPAAPDDFLIMTPEELSKIVTRQSRDLVIMLSFIAGVSLLVSGIVIMNIMLVAVSERRHEIGLKRALGARRRDILVQVLLESLMVALAGGGLGLAAGLALSRLFTAAFQVPTAFSPQGYLVALAFSSAVGLVFGYWPARRAARLAPAEALR